MNNEKAIEYFEGRKWMDVPVELKGAVVDNISHWAMGVARCAFYVT